MCLITKQSDAKIASKDITCYKVLLKYGNVYISPCKHFAFFQNQPNPNKVFNAEKSYWLENFPNDDLKPNYIDDEGNFSLLPVSYELNYGFFHMYKDYESALKELKNDIVTLEPSIIFECVIPKGSRYYEGVTALYSVPSIASDKLKIIKQL